MRFAFVAKHRRIWPVSWLCEALDMSRSGFHAWLTRPVSTHAIADERPGEAIGRSFRRSDRTCGARRVWHDVLRHASNIIEKYASLVPEVTDEVMAKLAAFWKAHHEAGEGERFIGA